MASTFSVKSIIGLFFSQEIKFSLVLILHLILLQGDLFSQQIGNAVINGEFANSGQPLNVQNCIWANCEDVIPIRYITGKHCENNPYKIPDNWSLFLQSPDWFDLTNPNNFSANPLPNNNLNVPERNRFLGFAEEGLYTKLNRKINKYSAVKLKYWYQYSFKYADRKIPPAGQRGRAPFEIHTYLSDKAPDEICGSSGEIRCNDISELFDDSQKMHHVKSVEKDDPFWNSPYTWHYFESEWLVLNNDVEYLSIMNLRCNSKEDTPYIWIDGVELEYRDFPLCDNPCYRRAPFTIRENGNFIRRGGHPSDDFMGYIISGAHKVRLVVKDQWGDDIVYNKETVIPNGMINYFLKWNGGNNNGTGVATGTYIFELSAYDCNDERIYHRIIGNRTVLGGANPRPYPIDPNNIENQFLVCSCYLEEKPQTPSVSRDPNIPICDNNSSVIVEICVFNTPDYRPVGNLKYSYELYDPYKGFIIESNNPCFSITKPGAYLVRVKSINGETVCYSDFSSIIDIYPALLPLPTFQFVQEDELQRCALSGTLRRFEMDVFSCPGDGCSYDVFYSYMGENELVYKNRNGGFFDVNVLNTYGTITVILKNQFGCETKHSIEIFPTDCCPAIIKIGSGGKTSLSRKINLNNAFSSQINPNGEINPTSIGSNEMRFEGTLTIDRTTVFKDMTLKFTPNAQIVMSGSYTLTFDNCTLDCCGDQMWNGIDATNGRIILTNNSVLACAKTGVTLAQSAQMTVTNSTLDRNNDHIVIADVENPLRLDQAVFDCTAPLVAPFAGEITKRAITAQRPSPSSGQRKKLLVGSTTLRRNQFRKCFVTAIEARNYDLELENNTIDLINSGANGNGGENGDGVVLAPDLLENVALRSTSPSPAENIIRNVRHGISMNNALAFISLLVSNCTIEDASQNGINISGEPPSLNMLIRYNNIRRCSTGIFVDRASLNYPFGISIIDNPQISNCARDGIRLGNLFFNVGADLKIDRNTISQIQRDGIRIDNGINADSEHSVFIRRNTITNVGLAPTVIDGVVGGGIYFNASNFDGSVKDSMRFVVRGNYIQNEEEVQPMFYGIFAATNTRITENQELGAQNPNITNFASIRIMITPDDDEVPNTIQRAYRGICLTSPNNCMIRGNQLYDIVFRPYVARNPENKFDGFYHGPAGISIKPNIRRNTASVNTIRDNHIEYYSGSPVADANQRFPGIRVLFTNNNEICNNTVIGFQEAAACVGEDIRPSRLKVNKFHDYRVGVLLSSSWGTRSGGTGAQYDRIDFGGNNNNPPEKVRVWNNEFHHDPPKTTAGIFTHEYRGGRTEWAVRSGVPYYPGSPGPGQPETIPASLNDLVSESKCQDSDLEWCKSTVRTTTTTVILDGNGRVIFDNRVNIVQEQTGCGTFQALPDPNPGRPRFKYNQRDVEDMIGIARESIINPTLFAGDYMAKQSLYELLQFRTDIRAAQPVLDSFALTVPQTNIGKLYAVDRKIDSALSFTVTRQVPCLPPNSTDTVTAFCPGKNAMRTRALNNAMTLNNAIVPQNIIENNHKAVNEVRISQLLNFTIALNPSQETIIREVAQQCPNYGGRAVFQARHMYWGRDNFNLPFVDTCDVPFSYPTLQPPLLPRSQDAFTASKPVFDLYPNPADDFLELSYRLKESTDQGKLQLYSSLGQIVKEIPFSGTNSQLKIETAELASGIYTCRITINGETLKTQKIQITR